MDLEGSFIGFSQIMKKECFCLVVDAGDVGGQGQVTREAVIAVYNSAMRPVYVVGSHWTGDVCEDYYYDGEEELSFLYKCSAAPDSGTFSDAYRATTDMDSYTRCKQGRDAHLDSLVLAAAITTMSMQGRTFDIDGLQEYMPCIFSTSWGYCASQEVCFKEMDNIGFYLIVPDERWFELASRCGVKTIQLRVKDKPHDEVERIIYMCANIAEKHDVKFILNDYWRFALKYNVHGVHLGQEDIKKADLRRLSDAGLMLGISTHCYHELARACYLKPSYIALGPIYSTTSKQMQFHTQGLSMLKRWVMTSAHPVVAIGGISLSNIHDVINCGAKGYAVISAVNDAQDPVEAIMEFLSICDKC
ncbi:MAG: thiamine phosphate synthase [Aaplasma endosymbiont of Hyalomma asiaticum]